MLTKVLGVLSIGVGLFFLIGGPGDRVQIEAYGNTARILGLIMIIVGIVLLMF